MEQYIAAVVDPLYDLGQPMPSPKRLGRALGISRQHVKDLCRELGLEMLNKAAPGAGQPAWVIPRESAVGLVAYLRGVRG